MTAKLWGGRFEKTTEKVVEKFTSSIDFDKKLYEEDVEGSIAHVRMLAKTGIISDDEADVIIGGLLEIKHEIQEGRFEFCAELEDIHMHIENRLAQKIGQVAGKLHSARSRNDQIALDMHIYVKKETDRIIKLIEELQEVILRLAKEHEQTLMPGYTHMQKAQPVTLSYHLKAYCHMFERDKGRLLAARKGADIMPLGACALAGTILPIDKDYTKEILGFSRIYENTMDAVSDRDFVIEFISCCSILMVHLSRLAEELVLWNTEEYNFIELDDAFATGSSIMPQKKNPDVPELIRGKSGRVFGNLMSVLTIMKALPLAYNRDMQEDKEALFDTAETVSACLEVLAPLLSSMRIKKNSMKSAVEDSFADATDYAEYLVMKGMPFREAHEVVGKMVACCIRNKKRLKDLSISELKDFSPLFGEQDVIGCSTESIKKRNLL